LISPAGQRTSAGAAAAPLARLLKGIGALAPMFERMPTLTERGYRWVADHRSWFGRMIPESAKRSADDAIRQRAASASGRFADRYSSSASGASVSS
jgi:predicted DCC family thiol-disulfide oxidoreductase YuxK